MHAKVTVAFLLLGSVQCLSRVLPIPCFSVCDQNSTLKRNDLPVKLLFTQLATVNAECPLTVHCSSVTASTISAKMIECFSHDGTKQVSCDFSVLHGSKDHGELLLRAVLSPEVFAILSKGEIVQAPRVEIVTDYLLGLLELQKKGKIANRSKRAIRSNALHENVQNKVVIEIGALRKREDCQCCAKSVRKRRNRGFGGRRAGYINKNVYGKDMNRRRNLKVVSSFAKPGGVVGVVAGVSSDGLIDREFGNDDVKLSIDLGSGQAFTFEDPVRLEEGENKNGSSVEKENLATEQFEIPSSALDEHSTTTEKITTLESIEKEITTSDENINGSTNFPVEANDETSSVTVSTQHNTTESELESVTEPTENLKPASTPMPQNFESLKTEKEVTVTPSSTETLDRIKSTTPESKKSEIEVPLSLPLIKKRKKKLAPSLIAATTEKPKSNLQLMTLNKNNEETKQKVTVKKRPPTISHTHRPLGVRKFLKPLRKSRKRAIKSQKDKKCGHVLIQYEH